MGSTSLKNYFDALQREIEVDLGVYRLSSAHEILVNGMMHARACLNIIHTLYQIPSSKLMIVEDYLNYSNLARLKAN